jgi:multidrug efflux pump subunit AcrA (membrane-fusion protein)
MEYDINIIQLEIVELIRQAGIAGPGADYHLRASIDSKRIQLERQQLTLAQAMEQQSFEMTEQLNALNNLRALLNDTLIVAPFDGVVTHIVPLSRGQWVSLFTPYIFISDETTVIAEMHNPENDISSNKIALTGILNNTPVRLERIPLSRSEQALMQTVPGDIGPLRFSVVDYPGTLTPGDHIIVQLHIHSRENVLRVPANSVNFERDLGDYVHVFSNGIRSLRQVEVGLRILGHPFVEILSGLEEGELVYVRQ